MLSFEEVNILGQILDSTWGKSSTSNSQTMSVKAKLSGEHLTLTYSTFTTFASNIAMSQNMSRLIDEGTKATNQFLKNTKEEFKEQSGRTLKTEILSSNESVEVVSLQPHVSPKRTILFRFIVLLKVD